MHFFWYAIKLTKERYDVLEISWLTLFKWIWAYKLYFFLKTNILSISREFSCRSWNLSWAGAIKMRSKVRHREKWESARVYENSSMHGQALLVVCMFSWVYFVSFFYWDISCFPVMGSVYVSLFFSLQYITYLMSIYASLWFVPYLLWDVFLCCWEKRKMDFNPLDFPRNKQVVLGFSQYASDQQRAHWEGRNSIYIPGLVLFTPRLNNEIIYSKIYLLFISIFVFMFISKTHIYMWVVFYPRHSWIVYVIEELLIHFSFSCNLSSFDQGWSPQGIYCFDEYDFIMLINKNQKTPKLQHGGKLECFPHPALI